MIDLSDENRKENHIGNLHERCKRTGAVLHIVHHKGEVCGELR